MTKLRKCCELTKTFLTHRTSALVCKCDNLVKSMMVIAEPDLFILEIFNDASKGEDILHCTTHLMNCLLKSAYHQSFWQKWHRQGILAKIAIEFTRCQNRVKLEIATDEEKARESA